MKNSDLEALKAEFATRGGRVTRVDTGKRAIESDRAIYKAMREGTRVVADSVAESRNSESRSEMAFEAFRESKYIGGSDSEALDAYNFERNR